ncbi:sugar ABC transporter permease [Luedemannella helvata]|uniref:Sugar ABC transporter permease n=1 Tax=Luedemannella helvata TaxID=349315 RepID=A0ABP4WRH5_9ACTN
MENVVVTGGDPRAAADRVGSTPTAPTAGAPASAAVTGADAAAGLIVASAGGDDLVAPESRRRRGLFGADRATPYLLIAPAVVALLALLGYPLYRVVVLSFQAMGHRQLIRGEDPAWVGFANYTRIFQDSVFWSVVVRTVAFTAVAVVLSVLLGLAVALLMRRVARPVRTAMVVAMMLAWAMPGLVSSQVFLWLVDANFGVVNWMIDQIPGVDFHNHSWFADPLQGWIVITAVVVWGALPFLAITLFAGMSQVPKELSEAATVDGANPWQVFCAVTLPILRPLLGIVTTLSIIWDFQVFTQIWVLRNGRPEDEFQTLSIHSFITAFGQSKYSLGSAVAVVTVLLMLGVMIFYVRQMFKIGEQD